MPISLELIGQVLAALVVSFLIALILTPVVRNLAVKVGAVDVPKDNRRMHKRPIPLMGGLAIFLGFLLGALLFVPLNGQYRALLLGSVIIVVLGIFDAIYHQSFQTGGPDHRCHDCRGGRKCDHGPFQP